MSGWPLGLGWPLVIVLLVATQRAAELLVARRNARRLLAAGAVEHGAGHYPLFILLHATWLVALVAIAVRDPALHLVPLVAYLALQPARLWVIGTLGWRWATRVLVLPGEPLVVTGPFRFVRHPNYLIAALEIPLLPLALGAPWLAFVFGLLNLGLLAWRIRVEEAALSGPEVRPQPGKPTPPHPPRRRAA